MTVQVQVTETQQPLTTRIEKNIRKALDRHTATTNLPRAVYNAINEVAAANQAQAARQGWEPHEIEGIRLFTCKVGAKVAADLVDAGYMTADEFLNA